MKRTALTIAGSDPSGGAGLQSDLRTFGAFNVTGLSVVTSLTAQNNRTVKAALRVPPGFLVRQIEVLMEEYDIDAVKTGMLGSIENARALARFFKRYRLKNLVLDPVLRSTGGYPLLGKGGASASVTIMKLLPFATVVTPNIPEAEEMTGVRITGAGDMEMAALKIHSEGAANVLIKGGHMKGDAVDVLYDGSDFRYFRGTRLRGKREKFHGTGCMLSAAIAAGLAKGASMEKAVRDAKRYVGRVLEERG